MLRLVAALALLFGCPGLAGARGEAPGDFDFYVLALSWSPSYCEAERDRADPDQCATDRPYAFVVHGLWPQYERGYPEHCPYEGPRRLPPGLVDRMLDIMPSRALVRHEWEKHGTCSGLSPSRYFETVRQAYGKVAIPPAFRRLEAPAVTAPEAVERAFQAANPGLEPDMIAVTCDRTRLREVRICMDKELRFRTCGPVDRQACRREEIRLPPSRPR
ncbi:MAG: ribonuclease T2 [Pseudomonadota bacterium]|nr:ribonuclease T2 [Pseudomonadota bacterium]